MRFVKITLITLSCSFAMGVTYAQKVHHGGKVMRTITRHNYNVIKMSRSKAKTVCPIFEDTGYPYQGLGVKFGDPFAITYKYYPNKHIGVVVDLGKSSSGLYSRYYSQIFSEYTQPDTIDLGESVAYYSHNVKSDWVGEVKLLYHIEAERLSPGLQVYSGIGLEARSLTINYDYQILSSVENKIRGIERSRFTSGIEVIVGIEYSYFKLPMSAFMELEYYVDVLKDPGWRKVQGGVGLRYVF